jgi:hypothetical protein
VVASITPSLHHSITPSLHHSITPLLHYSITPLLHYSITPLLHYSITPLLHHSITSSRTTTSFFFQRKSRHSITGSLPCSLMISHVRNPCKPPNTKYGTNPSYFSVTFNPSLGASRPWVTRNNRWNNSVLRTSLFTPQLSNGLSVPIGSFATCPRSKAQRRSFLSVL